MLDNYQNPFHKYDSDETYKKYRTNNESCIDDLNIYFKVEGNKVVDASFNGEACAISTSATSIMLRNIVGKTIDEIKDIVDNYKKMINEEEYNEEILKDLNNKYEANVINKNKGFYIIEAKNSKKL